MPIVKATLTEATINVCLPAHHGFDTMVGAYVAVCPVLAVEGRGGTPEEALKELEAEAFMRLKHLARRTR
jgi:hypothetical protein